MLLRDFYNFTLKYHVTRGWAGRLPSGFRLGLIGVLQRNEADVAASGIFNRLNRFDEFDIVHQSWKFEAAFIFRVTNELDNMKKKSFFSPFAMDVWIVLLIIIFLILFILKWIKIFLMHFSIYCSELTMNGIFVNMLIAALCQQGINVVNHSHVVRIIMLSILILSLLLYNYYTSTIVGVLLSTTVKGPQNLEEIIESPLILSFEDTGFHKILFREANRSIVKELYKTKVISQTRSKKFLLPVYASIALAVPFLKKGGYAFHCETTGAYPTIAKQFDANEICDIRAVNGLLETELMNLNVPKRSMYTEMFRIGMMRVQEVGLVKRALKLHKVEKPKCLSGATVHPVTIRNVSSAFALLGVGAVFAIFSLGLEIARANIL